jgi:large conductance mechanosensitive channel
VAIEEKFMQEEKATFGAARGLWNDFKQFAVKGNVIDLAVAVVIGSAFSNIVNSLVSNIIQPFISLLGSGASLQSESIVLRATSTPATPGAQPVAAVVLNYGAFLQSIESFIIIAGSIFLMIKVISAARDRLFRQEQKGEAPPAIPSPEVAVLQEIRDTLKEMKEQKGGGDKN